MTKRKTLLALLPAFLIGGILGGLMLHSMHNHVSERTASQAAEGDVRQALFILKRLRDGKTNEVIELMENRLDNSLINFSTSGQRKTSSSKRTFKQASEYRKQFPRLQTTPSEADEFLKKSLSEAESEE